MLQTNKICLHYGSSQILYNISLKASIGEITCLMGSNGVGKTSLLKALSTILQTNLNQLSSDSLCKI